MACQLLRVRWQRLGETAKAVLAGIQSLLTDLLIDRDLITTPADINLEGEVIKNGDNRLSPAPKANRKPPVGNVRPGQCAPG